MKQKMGWNSVFDFWFKASFPQVLQEFCVEEYLWPWVVQESKGKESVPKQVILKTDAKQLK